MPPCPLPPPPPSCAPNSYDVVSVDTSHPVNGIQWSLHRVIGASTETNEWALLPIGEIDMLLKGKQADNTEYVPVKRTNVDRVESVLRSSSIKYNQDSTFCTIVEPSSVTGDASIAVATLKDNSIVTHIPLSNYQLPIFWDGHPTLSHDGKFLVFASDRPGTQGGTDLWYCVHSADGEWSEPHLLEGGINTPCDELSPYFTAADSTILFSSAGHSTVGGYDLFEVSIYRNGNILKSGTPRNLGRPLNSEFDELFPRTTDDNTLYFSSNRPYSGTHPKDFDVFVLTNKKVQTPVQPKQIEKPTTIVTGTVINQKTQEPVKGADVTARITQSNEIVSTTKTDTSGDYALPVPVETPVTITAQTPDLFFDETRIVVPPTSARDTFRIKQPFALPEIFILRVNFPTAVFNDPYEHTLDSNGIETTQTWQDALDQLASNVQLSGRRLKKLVLIGHTDDVDDDSSNMILGRNRVNFVMDELVKRGVSRSILEGRSAGETMLPARRKDESTDIWRKRARRVELVKVLQD